MIGRFLAGLLCIALFLGPIAPAKAQDTDAGAFDAQLEGYIALHRQQHGTQEADCAQVDLMDTSLAREDVLIFPAGAPESLLNCMQWTSASPIDVPLTPQPLVVLVEGVVRDAMAIAEEGLADTVVDLEALQAGMESGGLDGQVGETGLMTIRDDAGGVLAPFVLFAPDTDDVIDDRVYLIAAIHGEAESQLWVFAEPSIVADYLSQLALDPSAGPLSAYLIGWLAGADMPEAMDAYATLRVRLAGEIDARAYDKALETIDALIGDAEPMAADLNIRAGILSALGRYADALEQVDHAIALAPEDAVYHGQRAAYLRELERDEEAAEAYAQALSLDPQADRYAYGLAILRYRLGDFNGALAAIDRAIEINPRTAAYHRERGLNLGLLGSLEEAVVALDIAIRLDPEQAVYYSDRSVARSRLGDMDAALTDIDKAIELEPEYAYYYYGRAMILSMCGNPADAVTTLERAIELAPQSALYQGELAEALYAAGDYERAAEAAVAAAALDDTVPAYAFRLAEAYNALGRPQDALAAIDRAIALDDTAAAYYRVRAQAQLQAERPDDALESIEMAMARRPGTAPYYAILAEIQAMQGQYRNALASLAEASALAPGDESYAARIDAMRTAMYEAARDAGLIGEAVVQNSTLNVRSGPGTEYGAVAKLSVGTVVDVLEDDGSGWFRVALADGTEGYVSARLVAFEAYE